MKLKNLEHRVQHAIEAVDGTGINDIYRDLTELRKLYIDGLPKKSYTSYGEVYDGLLLALQKMMKAKNFESQVEELSLCSELLQFIKAETEKERNFKREIVFFSQSNRYNSINL